MSDPLCHAEFRTLDLLSRAGSLVMEDRRLYHSLRRGLDPTLLLKRRISAPVGRSFDPSLFGE